MRACPVFVACVILAGLATPAQAVIGTSDNVPGATLLIPYFEVDLDNPNGTTTLVTVQNSSATAILANVTLWTDLGVPTLDFVVYLTGYDVQAMNLRDVLAGFLPVTASAGQDPADSISHHGPLSQDINFATCTGVLPYPLPALDAQFVADLQASHTGQASAIFFGLCAGFDHGDNIARGYVTVDTVNQCTLLNPASPGYFVSGGGGVATNQNVLLGDWMNIDPTNNFMQADRAVAIEASSTDPLVTTPGNYTFYGSLIGGSAADNREPLPTAWGARYMAERSYLRVWRDPGQAVAPFTCGTLPAPFPLDDQQVVAFDAVETPQDLTGTTLPLVAFWVPVGAPGIPATAKQGWMFLDLDSPTVAGEFSGQHQAWVEVVHDIEDQGRFSAGWPGVQLRQPQNATAALPATGGAP